MIELWMIQYLYYRFDSSCFGIKCAINQSGKTRMNNGSGAHGAWLQRDVQLATR